MRDDFSEDAKRVLAQRVSHHCSNPNCRASTSGPQVNPTKHLNVGVAAHISAAAAGGPRYDASLTPEQRRHSDNGLWLCQNCAKIIDNDEARFPAYLLHEWKSEAEAEALAAIGRTATSPNEVGVAATKRIERAAEARHEEVKTLLEGLYPLQSVASNEPAVVVFNAPDQNEFFTGRNDVEDAICTLLKQGKRVALHGMSGIGKTQIAADYAHRYRADYSYVFWVNAVDGTALLSGYNAIAQRILFQQAEQINQEGIAETVREWLNTHSNWLLIFDNADHLDAVREYLPSGRTGHVIFTTVQSSFGNIAQGVEVDGLSREDGALLVLRRARRVEADAKLETAVLEDRDAALALSQEMQGLPLALDQAGAYMEDADYTPAQYLDIYRRRNVQLLSERGNNPVGHPNAAAVTISLALGKLEQANPAATELLQACALLAPFMIPEELFICKPDIWPERLGTATSDEIAWGRMIKAAKNLSLIQRDAGTRSLSVHQLVQLVIKDMMTGEEQCLTVERHVIAIDNILAHYHETEAAVRLQLESPYERLKLQIGWVGLSVEAFKIYTLEAVRVYMSTSLYLADHGIWVFARDLNSFAIEMITHIAGDEHVALADPLNYLGVCYYHLDQFDKAVEIYQKAIAVAKRVPDLAQSANHSIKVGVYYDNLMTAYHALGKYDKAAQAAQKAAEFIATQARSADRHTAILLNNQASLCLYADDLVKAEELFKKSAEIIETEYGSEWHELSLPLGNLACLYEQKEELEKAEFLFVQCLQLREKHFGSASAQLVEPLNRLADFYYHHGRDDDAEPLYSRSLEIVMATSGSGPERIVQALNNLGVLIQKQERYIEAEHLLKQALSIRERYFGTENPRTAQSYKNLGVVYYFLERYTEAEDLYKKSLVIREREYGVDSAQVDMVLSDYINLLLKLDRFHEATRMTERSDAIRAKYEQALTFCEDH